MFKETAPEVTLLNSRIIYTLSPTKIYRTALLKIMTFIFQKN
ncbi:hypothetical protein ACV56Z_10055 [Staphylococcus aureus]